MQALAEMIWNAFDADAFDVKVDIIQNALGGVEAIRVADDGSGINVFEVERHFGNLGGSWKRDHSKTPLAERVLHGSKGRGRFKAFSLGNRVQWRTTCQTPEGLRSYVLEGSAADPSMFTLSQAASIGPAPGTEVMISEVSLRLDSLLDSGWMVQQLASHFALYLKAYPNARLYYQGLLVNPVIVQRANRLYHLRASDGSKADLQVIEWKTRQGRGKVVFCNSEGFALHEVDAAVRPGSGFNFTAYLIGAHFERLHAENILALEELHPETRAFLEAARDTLRKHFRERREALSSAVVEQWRSDGVYPYRDPPTSAAESARQQRFDAVAMAVRAYSDNFDNLAVAEKHLLFYLLHERIESNFEETIVKLAEIFKLPLKRQRELAKLQH